MKSFLCAIHNIRACAISTDAWCEMRKLGGVGIASELFKSVAEQ